MAIRNKLWDLLNVRFGSIADLQPEVPRTSAFGGIADIQIVQNCPLRTSALCQKRTLVILLKDDFFSYFPTLKKEGGVEFFTLKHMMCV